MKIKYVFIFTEVESGKPWRTSSITYGHGFRFGRSGNVRYGRFPFDSAWNGRSIKD